MLIGVGSEEYLSIVGQSAMEDWVFVHTPAVPDLHQPSSEVEAWKAEFLATANRFTPLLVLSHVYDQNPLGLPGVCADAPASSASGLAGVECSIHCSID